MKVSWLCFQTSRWCGGFTHRRTITEEQAWGHGWVNHVPYLLRVECLEWIIEKWLTVWGLSATGVTYNIANEMFQAGAVDSQGFMVWMGDDKYAEAVKTKNPFMKNPYGQTLITAVKQNHRNNAAWVISYRYISNSSGDTVFVDPVYHTEQEWQPVYDEFTFSVIQGTMPTWRWDLMMVVVPNILKRNLDDFWETLSHDLNVTKSGGGYQSRAKSADTQVGYYGYDFTELFTSGGRGAAPVRAVAPDAAAQEEN
nr:MAG: capsid protein [Enontekio totivirus 2]